MARRRDKHSESIPHKATKAIYILFVKKCLKSLNYDAGAVGRNLQNNIAQGEIIRNCIIRTWYSNVNCAGPNRWDKISAFCLVKKNKTF